MITGGGGGGGDMVVYCGRMWVYLGEEDSNQRLKESYGLGGKTHLYTYMFISGARLKVDCVI